MFYNLQALTWQQLKVRKIQHGSLPFSLKKSIDNLDHLLLVLQLKIILKTVISM
jgi:hypothetical protein